MTKEITTNTLMEAGVQYGYSRTRRHPTVSNFIYGNKKGSDIIDIEKIVPQIEEAAKFMTTLGQAGKTALFVGVKPEARGAVTEVATSIKQPYVIERWIGGTLTNFVEIKRRIQKLEDMKEKIANGEFSKYTKKEQLLLTREMERLNRYFSGLIGMNKMPDVMVVVDAKKEHIAVAEARRMNIPVISISNTDASIRAIDYPIVANDGSVSSIKVILDILKDAFIK